MTDRELLELAARAANYRVHGWIGDVFYVVDTLSPSENFDPFKWNPLADDGDALRLAVKLELVIEYRRKDDACFVYHYNTSREWSQRNQSADACAATRRAIVRAAAEVGKQL